jgi:uncharacterized protein with NRDE domain
MCTLTHVSFGNNNFILISNRDETPFRKTLSSQRYPENSIELTVPKDAITGGTWIVLSKKTLGLSTKWWFETHIRKTSYKMSRGVIVK